jgi:Peroxisome biogenesis factor 1, N-terminal
VSRSSDVQQADTVRRCFSCTTDDADLYIGLPSSFVPSCPASDEVLVHPIDNVATAEDLFVEPCTAEDWELVELNAAWLEQGGLLQQVSLVYSGQILHIRLSNTATMARLMVSPRNFDPNQETSSIWPRHRPRCVRLAADTQLVVIPKPRPTIPPTMLQVVPTREDYWDRDPSVLTLAARLNVDLPSVSQGTGTVHPTTLSNLCCGESMDENDVLGESLRFATIEHDNQRAIVMMVASDHVREDCVGKTAHLCVSIAPLKVFNEDKYHANSDYGFSSMDWTTNFESF